MRVTVIAIGVPPLSVLPRKMELPEERTPHFDHISMSIVQQVATYMRQHPQNYDDLIGGTVFHAQTPTHRLRSSQCLLGWTICARGLCLRFMKVVCGRLGIDARDAEIVIRAFLAGHTHNHNPTRSYTSQTTYKFLEA